MKSPATKDFYLWWELQFCGSNRNQRHGSQERPSSGKQYKSFCYLTTRSSFFLISHTQPLSRSFFLMSLFHNFKQHPVLVHIINYNQLTFWVSLQLCISKLRRVEYMSHVIFLLSFRCMAVKGRVTLLCFSSVQYSRSRVVVYVAINIKDVFFTCLVSQLYHMLMKVCVCFL